MNNNDGSNNDRTESLRGTSAEIDLLLNKLARNDLGESGMARLGELLTESEEARWAYIHAIHLTEGIKRWSKSQGEVDVSAIVDLLSQSVDPQDRELATEIEHQAINNPLLNRQSERDSSSSVDAQEPTYLDSRPTPTRIGGNPSDGVRPAWKRFGNRWAGLAVAASLLAALYWYGSPQQGDAPIFNEGNLAVNQTPANKVAYRLDDSEQVVARVTSATVDVSWSHGKEPQDFLMRLRPGDVIGVDKGFIQIQFSDGAHLVVESPAALQVTSATSARLMEGRVVGRADNGNFTLLTPTATVVDIGTEFGVGVSSAGTDVRVFEGEVHVHPLLGSVKPSSVKKLQRGMWVRIDPKGLSNSHPEPTQQHFQRSFGQPERSLVDATSVSLLDLLSGHESTQQPIAGSIDPKTGYWGRPPWLDPLRTEAQRGDTQFSSTDWNPMVDGVFIPRSNAREMQIDSDGHMVYLPPNSGSTWGPIWARRRFEQTSKRTLLSSTPQGYWGAAALSNVLKRLQQTSDGLMGLHANVGITFDLDAVREARARNLKSFRAIAVNLDTSPAGHSRGEDSPNGDSFADLRIFVDGKLRYSRLEFGRRDGDAGIVVALSDEDRFLTIVTTDAGTDPVFDHVVLIDPILEYEPPKPQPDRA